MGGFDQSMRAIWDPYIGQLDPLLETNIKVALRCTIGSEHRPMLGWKAGISSALYTLGTTFA